MSKSSIPRYLEDADMDNPEEHFAWAISQWPKVEKMMEMPTPAPLIPHLSKFLSALGFRHHPELQVLFKVPDAETGRAKFVDEDEYEELKAKGGGSVVEGAATLEALELLARINPKLAKELESLTAEERADRVKALEPDVDKSMQMLDLMRKQMEGTI